MYYDRKIYDARVKDAAKALDGKINVYSRGGDSDDETRQKSAVHHQIAISTVPAGHLQGIGSVNVGSPHKNVPTAQGHYDPHDKSIHIREVVGRNNLDPSRGIASDHMGTILVHEIGHHRQRGTGRQLLAHLPRDISHVPLKEERKRKDISTGVLEADADNYEELHRQSTFTEGKVNRIGPLGTAYYKQAIEEAIYGAPKNPNSKRTSHFFNAYRATRGGDKFLAEQKANWTDDPNSKDIKYPQHAPSTLNQPVRQESDEDVANYMIAERDKLK
jgi:hypothetical protein